MNLHFTKSENHLNVRKKQQFSALIVEFRTMNLERSGELQNLRNLSG